MDTSPEARRAFLDGLEQRRFDPATDRPGRGEPGGGLLADIADAELAVEACQRDMDAAADDRRVAFQEAPEQAHARHLDPEARHRYAAFLQASMRADRTEQALATAQARLSRLLRAYDDIAAGPHMNLPPGPDTFGWGSPYEHR